ncbi:hypothetical protein TSUD_70020 [Trifolium subterraneum]|uniref:Uncharacterized protein n=1 Tax=Trifolium subterraneum TaxID=3900 RepID=A0A2Z6NU87_TRISU|nr:hypothetical protein TSUD_70020 [Trifolium subterraneum]
MAEQPLEKDVPVDIREMRASISNVGHLPMREVSELSNNTDMSIRFFLPMELDFRTIKSRSYQNIPHSKLILRCEAYHRLQRKLDGHKVGLLLSACQSDEFGQQFLPPNGIGGKFTSLMIYVVYHSRGHITNQELICDVTQQLSMESPQHPGLYATEEQRDRLFFGGFETDCSTSADDGVYYADDPSDD